MYGLSEEVTTHLETFTVIAWQLCPKCGGSGEVNNIGGFLLCDVCNGKKIINIATGKPPE